MHQTEFSLFLKKSVQHKKSQENKNDKTKSNSQINDNDKTQNNSHINNNNKDKMINVRQNKTTESKNREQMTLLDNNSPIMISTKNCQEKSIYIDLEHNNFAQPSNKKRKNKSNNNMNNKIL